MVNNQLQNEINLEPLKVTKNQFQFAPGGKKVLNNNKSRAELPDYHICFAKIAIRPWLYGVDNFQNRRYFFRLYVQHNIMDGDLTVVYGKELLWFF